MITKIPKEEYKSRINKIQKVLRKRGIDIFVTFGSESEPQNIIYLSNFWPAFETASIVVPAEGEPVLVIGPESTTFAKDFSSIDRICPVFEHRESAEPKYPGYKLDTYEKIFDEVLNGQKAKKIAFSGLSIVNLPVYRAIEKAVSIILISHNLQKELYIKYYLIIREYCNKQIGRVNEKNT